MTRRVLVMVLAPALLAALRSFGADPVIETPPESGIPVPDTGVPADADVKPEDFVYVAATRLDRIGRVMAPVFINGLGPFAFVVDTGASSSVISPRVVSRLKLNPDRSRAKLLRGITGSELVPTVPVESITVGEITLSQRELPVVEPRVFADADGILGADVFAGGCLYVDFANERVWILRTACPRVGDDWRILRATLRFGGLTAIDARIGRQRVVAIVDTGAERSLGNLPLLSASGLRKAAQDPKSQTQVFAATSQVAFGNLLDTLPLTLGEVTISDLQVVFGDFEVFRMWGIADQPAIVIGMDVLGTTQALMIDFRRQQARVLGQGDRNTVKIRSYSAPGGVPD